MTRQTTRRYRGPRGRLVRAGRRLKAMVSELGTLQVSLAEAEQDLVAITAERDDLAETNDALEGRVAELEEDAGLLQAQLAECIRQSGSPAA